MKKWLKLIFVGVVGIILSVSFLFYSYRAYVYVSSEKSYGEYSTRAYFLSRSPFPCGTEVITKTGGMWPLTKVNICEGNIEAIRREGDWLLLQINGFCSGTIRKNLITGETQTEGGNILSCRKW